MRTYSISAAEAIEYCLSVQAWQVNAIKEAVAEADSQKAIFHTHEAITDWLASWGSEQERK